MPSPPLPAAVPDVTATPPVPRARRRDLNFFVTVISVILFINAQIWLVLGAGLWAIGGLLHTGPVVEVTTMALVIPALIWLAWKISVTVISAEAALADGHPPVFSETAD
jgi:hypothetical protein